MGDTLQSYYNSMDFTTRVTFLTTLWRENIIYHAKRTALHCPLSLALSAFSEANLKRSEHAWLIVCRRGSQSQHFIQRPL